MAIQGRWKRLVYMVILSGVALGGVLVYGRSEVERRGGRLDGERRSMDALQECGEFRAGYSMEYCALTMVDLHLQMKQAALDNPYHP